MKIEQLHPIPHRRTQFAWSHNVVAPSEPGCYALATYNLDVLYVGLASASIRDRMCIHLDTEEKRKGGTQGVPFWLYYLLCPAKDVNRLERGWMNQSILIQGDIPTLNKIYSPL